MTCCLLLVAVVVAPAPDKQPDAVIEVLERKFRDERVKARLELLEKEEAVRDAERDLEPRITKATARIKALEGDLAQLRGDIPPGAAIKADIQERIKQLKASVDEHKNKLLQLRKDVITAEEELKSLEQVQEAKRRRVLAELGIPPVDGRSRELEKKVDSLQRSVEELRRELKRPPKEP
jgi:predicted  nucleic acid-binding Zn-ribbon protein